MRSSGLGVIALRTLHPTFLTTEGSDWYAFSGRQLRSAPKRLLRLAFMPALNNNAFYVVAIIQHKALDHFIFAFWALQFFGSHSWLGVGAANHRSNRQP